MSDNVNREKLRAVLESAIRAYLAASAPSPSSSGWTPTSDGPEPIEYECELCGGRLDGPYEKCGSAQHGPNGTVIYGRAVPVSPIPTRSSRSVTRCGAAWEPWQNPDDPTDRRYPGDPTTLCPSCYAETQEPPAP